MKTLHVLQEKHGKQWVEIESDSIASNITRMFNHLTLSTRGFFRIVKRRV